MTGPNEWPPVLRELVSNVEALVERLEVDPRVGALLDQEAAAVRDALDELGLDPNNPETLRAGLGMALLVLNRIDARDWTPTCLLRATLNGIVATLLDHLPMEARR